MWSTVAISSSRAFPPGTLALTTRYDGRVRCQPARKVVGQLVHSCRDVGLDDLDISAVSMEDGSFAGAATTGIYVACVGGNHSADVGVVSGMGGGDAGATRCRTTATRCASSSWGGVVRPPGHRVALPSSARSHSPVVCVQCVPGTPAPPSSGHRPLACLDGTWR